MQMAARLTPARGPSPKEYNETLEENDGDDKSPAMVVLKADLDEVRVRVEVVHAMYAVHARLRG